MKGLVLAGGSGTRLRPLTHTGAKQLVPVANRPILFYVIDSLLEADVRDIGVIISPETGMEVHAALQAYTQVKFTFIEQAKPRGLANAVAVARSFLGDDDFVMYLGDNLIGASLRDWIQKFQGDSRWAASVLLKEVTNPSAFGVAELNDGRVVRLVEKPLHPPSNMALVGVYLFRASIHPAVWSIEPSPRGEYEITDAIDWLIRSGARVHSRILDEWWLDTGKKDDLLLANDMVLDDRLRPALLGIVDDASSVQGRVRIEGSAAVIRSTIRGPTIIGEGARIVDSHIGPFTSIGRDVEVVESTVDHCVIMNGSRVHRIPRLEHSLIGKRVTVRSGAATYSALSLTVGDDSVVELASK